MALETRLFSTEPKPVEPRCHDPGERGTPGWRIPQPRAFSDHPHTPIVPFLLSLHSPMLTEHVDARHKPRWQRNGASDADVDAA